MGKVSRNECAKCKCADSTISYSDWWYCTNPKDFRDFTVLRDNCWQRPEWCSRELLEKVKKQILVCEEQKKRNPEYYKYGWEEHHKLFIIIKEELENGSNHDR